VAPQTRSRSAWLDFFLRLDRGLARFEITVASAALAAGLLVSLYTISARAALAPTAEWVLELPMELLVVASIFGSGYLVSQDRHLSVDVVVRRLPARLERRINLAVRGSLGLLSLFLAERAMTAAGQAARAGLTIPELFNLSAAIPLGIASVGLALWSLHFGVSVLELANSKQ
jgi:TRAP-type C4-dicarboxylate transport system permease small subunit